MKRVLYLSRGGYVGGSQRQLSYVLSNLNHGFEPLVVCREDGSFVAELRACGIRTSVFRFHPWRKLPAGFYRYWDAERVVRFARGRDVMLVHSSDLWLNGYLVWIARRLGVPSVLHVRTPISIEDVHKHRCDKATSIVAISKRVRRNLISAGISEEKITLIDDAVDLGAFTPQDEGVDVLRRDFGSKGEVLVGIVGRIHPLKRQLAFLEAAEQVVQGPASSVTFFVIGESCSCEYCEQLKRFAERSGLKGKVVFTGRREDMPEVLGSLDILVSLSGGSVMFEAMACGKAVISAGFSREEDSVHLQHGRTGLLVGSSQPAELAKALTRLIDDPEFRRRIGGEARKWAEKRLCHVAMAAKLELLYTRLVEG